MKVLLVSTVLSKGVVGPAKFARILRDSNDIDCDILVEGEEPKPNIIPISIEQGYFKRKLSLYNRIKPYQNKIVEVADQYDVILFSSGILAYKMPEIPTPFFVMINDDNYLSATPQWDKYRMIDFFYKRIERHIVKSSANIIVNSDFLKRALVKTYGCSPSKIKKLYKAIEIKGFDIRSSKIDKAKPIRILFVKNDYKRGGLYDLLEALGLLKDYNFELSIVGSTPSDMMPPPSNTNVQVYGGLPHKDVLNMMRTHDIYCVPSKREALGVANMEGMAMGIPVVTTNVGGIPEVVTEKEGWIAKPSDPKALSKCIKACIENNELRNKKIGFALEKVKIFSTENMITNLNGILANSK